MVCVRLHKPLLSLGVTGANLYGKADGDESNVTVLRFVSKLKFNIISM